MSTARLATLLLLLALPACRTTPPGEDLPRYQGLTDEQVLAALAERADQVQRVMASGTLLLDDKDRGPIHLDIAMLAMGNDRLRLRAWKLGQPAFDLTRDGDTLWLWVSDRSDEPQTPFPSAQQIDIGWALLSGRLFTAPPQSIKSGDTLEVQYTLDPSTSTRIQIDRQTLTITRLDIVSSGGQPQQTLLPEHYRLIDNHPWATRLTSTGSGGRFVLQLDEVEINGDLPPGVFKPPHNATRQP